MRLYELHLNRSISREFIDLCKHELELTNLPEIIFVNNDSVGNGSSFGEISFTPDCIKIATKNRHPMDIMRSLAHELVHWKQKCTKRDLDGSDGSYDENQANSLAGLLMRRFGKLHPEYFDQESF